MSIHKSDSNQLLVSLVVEHSRRATPPQEGEVEALRVPEPETDFSYSRPRGISSTIGEKHSLQPPNFESNRNPWYQERVFSTAVRGRSPSPEPDGSGSPGVLSGVIGTCFVSGTVPEEAEDEGACLASHTEQQAQHSHWRPFRREVTAADSKLTISGERLMSVSFEQLRSLPSLASLSEISVASNQLRNIDLRPIASCRSLQVLLLNDNLLEGVDLTPLASCTQLERLWLHRNKLKSIDLSPLAISGSALRSLYLGRNELEEINLAPLEKCSNLRALQLEGNTKLKEIDVTPLFACAELSSFEAPPHARLIVRELAALEAQRRSLEKLQVASEKGEISEKRDYGNVFSTKLVLPKVFRRRGIVLHWIQDNPTDALSAEDCGFLDEKGHDVDTRPFRPEGRAAAPAEKESSNVPHDESISPGDSHRECDISTDWEPGASSLSQQRSLVVMVVGMTTHRRISTCNLLETTSTFHVIQTSSVVGALDAIISTPDNIDLVLMEPSDFELLIEKTRKTSIPLCMPVVVIGPPEYERSGVFQRCVAHGAKGFISFPLDSRDARALMDVAQKFQASRREVCQNPQSSEVKHHLQRSGGDSPYMWDHHRANLVDSMNISDPASACSVDTEENKWVPQWWRCPKFECASKNSQAETPGDRMDAFLRNSDEEDQDVLESSALRFIRNARLTVETTHCGKPFQEGRIGSLQSDPVEWGRIEAVFANRDRRPSREPCFQTQLLQHFLENEQTLVQPSSHHVADLERFVDIAVACHLPKSVAPVLFLRALDEQELDVREGPGFPATKAIFQHKDSTLFVKHWSRMVHADSFYRFYRYKIAPAASPIERLYNIIASPWPGTDLGSASSGGSKCNRASKMQKCKARYVSKYTISLLIQELIYRKHIGGKTYNRTAKNLPTELSTRAPGTPTRYSYHGKCFLSSSNRDANLTSSDTSHFLSERTMSQTVGDCEIGDDICDLLLSASIASTCVWFHIGGGNRTYVPVSVLRKMRFAEAIYAAERGIIVDSLMEMLTGGGVALVAHKELQAAWNYQSCLEDASCGGSYGRTGNDLNLASWLRSRNHAAPSENQIGRSESMKPGTETSYGCPAANLQPSISMIQDLLSYILQRKYGISREAVVSYFLDRGSLVPRAVEQVLLRFQRNRMKQSSSSGLQSEYQSDHLSVIDDNQNRGLARNTEQIHSFEDDSLSPTAFVHLFLALCDPGSDKALDTFFEIMDLDMDGFISAADVAHFYREKCDLSFKEGLVLAPAAHLWAQLMDMCRTGWSNPNLEPRGITLRTLRRIGERRRSSLIRNVLFKDDGMALVDIQQTLRLESSLSIPNHEGAVDI